MRFIACLFACLTLLMSAVPCCTEGDACAEGPGLLTTGHAEGPCDEVPEGEGPCSPFYACGSCPGCVAPQAMEPVVSETPDARQLIADRHPNLFQSPPGHRLLRPPIPMEFL